MKNGISIKALFLGILTDIGGSLIATIVFSLIHRPIIAVYSVRLMSSKQPPATSIIPMWLSPLIPDTFGYKIITLLIGMAFTFSGAYLAARIAKRRELVYGWSIGVINVILSAVTFRFPLSWFSLSAVLFPLPMSLLGSVLARRRNKSIQTV